MNLLMIVPLMTYGSSIAEFRRFGSTVVHMTMSGARICAEICPSVGILAAHEVFQENPAGPGDPRGRSALLDKDKAVPLQD